MFFGTFWEHHTCLYNYHVLIISYLCAILCYSEEIAKYVPIVVKLCYAIVSVSAMLVYTRQKNIAQVFILERYFFVSIYPAAIPGTYLAMFLVAVLQLC